MTPGELSILLLLLLAMAIGGAVLYVVTTAVWEVREASECAKLRLTGIERRLFEIESQAAQAVVEGVTEPPKEEQHTWRGVVFDPSDFEEDD